MSDDELLGIPDPTMPEEVSDPGWPFWLRLWIGLMPPTELVMLAFVLAGRAPLYAFLMPPALAIGLTVVMLYMEWLVHWLDPK